jgi:ABC-type oligopeptide transport system substrate-binding subunit
MIFQYPKKNHSIITFLVVLFLLAIVGCAKKESEIRAIFPYNPNDDIVDPAKLDITHRYYVMDNISAKLLIVNHQNDYEFILAESIVLISDTEYEIKLKNNIVFSNGEEIVADDVIRSFKRMILLGSSHVPMKDIVLGSEKISKLDQEVEGLKKIDNKKILLRLSKKMRNFLYLLSLADSAIIHRKNAEKDLIKKSDWDIVSGAYFIKDDTLQVNKKFVGYNENIPHKVHLVSSPQQGTIKDLEGFDIGFAAFLDKESGDFNNPSSSAVFTSDTYTMLVYLHLNPDSNLFKNTNLRRTVFQKINESLVTPDNNKLFKKADQYFLPVVAGVNKNYSFQTVLKQFKTSAKIPKFKILATKGTKKYTFSALQENIRRSLGVDVTVEFTDEMTDYYRRMHDRSFDAYIVPASINYNTPTDSLNYLVTAKDKIAKTKSKKLKEMILNVHSLPTSTGMFDPLLDEMALDATVLPLFYVSSPKFYNEKTIDATMMNKTESMTFWRLKVL